MSTLLCCFAFFAIAWANEVVRYDAPRNWFGGGKALVPTHQYSVVIPDTGYFLDTTVSAELLCDLQRAHISYNGHWANHDIDMHGELHLRVDVQSHISVHANFKESLMKEIRVFPLSPFADCMKVTCIYVVAKSIFSVVGDANGTVGAYFQWKIPFEINRKNGKALAGHDSNFLRIEEIDRQLTIDLKNGFIVSELTNSIGVKISFPGMLNVSTDMEFTISHEVEIGQGFEPKVVPYASAVEPLYTWPNYGACMYPHQVEHSLYMESKVALDVIANYWIFKFTWATHISIAKKRALVSGCWRSTPLPLWYEIRYFPQRIQYFPQMLLNYFMTEL